MIRRYVIALTMLMTAAGTGAQEAAPRAWQQRLHAEIPVPVPVVALESVNPFSTSVDIPPIMISSTAPRKVPVAGEATVAAYVDSKGGCLGAVPLELPFPGLTTAIVDEFRETRFDPARTGNSAQPSWTVVEIVVAGKVKESVVTDQSLELPDPAIPPTPSVPPPVAPSGNLVNLPFSPPEALSSVATPRRMRLKAPSREADVLVKALVHVTPEGRTDRFVPLDLAPGFDAWLSSYLNTWRMEPAVRDGQPVGCWVVYNARASMKVSSLESTSFRVSTEKTYNPDLESLP
jgi:hypothetical protein